MATGDHRATRNRERESKLIAPVEFSLPDLTQVVADANVIVLPEVHLDAVYYDTTDLRLARSGITLRYRRGEPGIAWTVKLPASNDGNVLDRAEIGFAGSPDQVPAEASDLVIATTRTEGLNPVARLATVRQPVEIRDNDGQLLVEIVDDTVTVSADAPAATRFREVEIELHANQGATRRLHRAVTARLVEAGCVADPPVPKLIRALGEPATRPPDVVVNHVGSDASIPGLIQHAIGQCVAQMLHHDPGVRLGDDPEDVHELRVATRRLRSDLRTFSAVLERDLVDPIRAELGWLGAIVGAVRDTDVLTSHLSSTGATLPIADASAVRLLMGRLDKQARTARTAMIDAMRGPRYLHLLDVIVDLATSPPIADNIQRLAMKPSTWCADTLQRQWRHLNNAVHELNPDPSDTELHQVRIRAKRCRYATEAVTPIVGEQAARFAAAIADVQTLLGDHQDTVVAETWLRDAASASPAARVAAGQLIAVERAQRADIRGQWPGAWNSASAKKLRWWR